MSARTDDRWGLDHCTLRLGPDPGEELAMIGAVEVSNCANWLFLKMGPCGGGCFDWEMVLERDVCACSITRRESY